MTYRLVQLAHGAYDVQWNGEPIAVLVSVSVGVWWVETWDTHKTFRQPFTQARHAFTSFDEARRWLGIPQVVMMPDQALPGKQPKGETRGCI
jgi:hypothetical protein